MPDSFTPSAAAPRLAAPGCRGWLALIATCVGLLLAAPALAANYRLDIEAPEELVEALRTRTLLGRWIDEAGFEAGQLPLFIERGREEALAIAQAAGYFSATAEVSLESTEAGATPRVRIVVDAGARTTVSRFDFTLDGPPEAQAMRARLLQRWPLPEGSFFLSSRWQEGKRLLLDVMQQHGFVRARIVDSRAEVDAATTAARLSLHVESGPRLTFGALTIKGLQRYPLSIVAALQPWQASTPGADGQPAQAGDPYSFEDLLTFQARLRASGYFDAVDVLPDLAAVEADPARNTVPVTVEVSERKVHQAMFGIGYSSDEGARGLLGYQQRNLLGRGWQLDSGVLLQSVRRRVFASVRTPQSASGHYYQAGARVERFDVQGELTRKQTLFLGQGKERGDATHFISLQYQREASELPLALDVERARALTLGYAWTRRRFDSQIDPRSGYSISAQVSGASRALASDRSFARFYARTMRFWPIPLRSSLGNGILIGLLEFGQVVAGGRDGIPSENLFRTGGTQSLRGYGYLSIGVPDQGAIVGGRVLAVASLEYQHPVAPNWFAATFVDVGDATDRWADYKVMRGYGIGARWHSPIGPISLDLAYGEAVRRWRAHLAVGYAF